MNFRKVPRAYGRVRTLVHIYSGHDAPQWCANGPSSKCRWYFCDRTHSEPIAAKFRWFFNIIEASEHKVGPISAFCSLIYCNWWSQLTELTGTWWDQVYPPKSPNNDEIIGVIIEISNNRRTRPTTPETSKIHHDNDKKQGKSIHECLLPLLSNFDEISVNHRWFSLLFRNHLLSQN